MIDLKIKFGHSEIQIIINTPKLTCFVTSTWVSRMMGLVQNAVHEVEYKSRFFVYVVDEVTYNIGNCAGWNLEGQQWWNAQFKALFRKYVPNTSTKTYWKRNRIRLLRNACMKLLITIKPRAGNGRKMSAAAARTISPAPSPTSASFVLFWERSCTSFVIPVTFCSSKRYLSCWHPPTDVRFAISTRFVYLALFRTAPRGPKGSACTSQRLRGRSRKIK